MKKLLFFRAYRLLILFFLVSIFIFAGCGKDKEPEILARVGEETISVDDFILSYELQPRPGARPRTIEERQRFLNRLIENKLLADYGYEKNYLNDPRIRPQIKAVSKEILIKQLYQNEVADKVHISESALRDGFAKSKTQIRARHLFVKAQPTADSLYKLLKQGSSFLQLSRNVFNDSTLANNGGDLGYFSFGDMDEDFEQAVFQLRVGEISPPVKTKWGYHIIKVEDKKISPIITETEFQSKKHTIERIIRQRREVQLANEYIKDFMAGKNVVVKAEAVNFLVKAARQLKQKTDPYLPGEMPQLMDEEIQQIQEKIHQHGQDILVEFDGGRWDVETFFKKLAETLPRDWPELTSHLSIANQLGVMVRNEFLYAEALIKGVSQSPAVERELQKEQDRIIANLARKDLIDAVEFSEQDCFHFYQKNIHKYKLPEKVKIREIVVATLSQADSLKQRIMSGEDFSLLAKKYSVCKQTAITGGEIGYISVNDSPHLTKYVKDLHVGQISSPQLIDNQYRIFQLLDRIDPQPIPYQDILNNVKKDLRDSLIRQKIDSTVNRVKEKISVWINYKLLENMKSIADDRTSHIISSD